MPALHTLAPISAQTQRLTFEHQGERRVLLGVLRHDHQQLQLALISPQGQRLLTLVQDDEGARFAPGAAFEPPFSAAWLASRLSFSLWPEARLREAFAGSDWSLEQRDHERRIYHQGRLAVRLEMTPTCHVIHDIEADYRLSVATLAPSPDARENKSPNSSVSTTTTNHNAVTDSPCPST